MNLPFIYQTSLNRISRIARFSNNKVSFSPENKKLIKKLSVLGAVSSTL